MILPLEKNRAFIFLSAFLLICLIGNIPKVSASDFTFKLSTMFMSMNLKKFGEISYKLVFVETFIFIDKDKLILLAAEIVQESIAKIQPWNRVQKNCLQIDWQKCWNVKMSIDLCFSKIVTWTFIFAFWWQILINFPNLSMPCHETYFDTLTEFLMPKVFIKMWLNNKIFFHSWHRSELEVKWQKFQSELVCPIMQKKSFLAG